MKKRNFVLIAAMAIGAALPSSATILFSDDFETGWGGGFASGWENTAYRHGAPPVSHMMQQSTTAHSGNFGLQLTAESVATVNQFWASVSVETLNHDALDSIYNPYVSVWYYDETTSSTGVGQLFAVPDWTNLYLVGGTEDWTDTQFGGRTGSNTDNYYHVAVGENHTGWDDTGVARTTGWHNLMFQLSSVDNRIHYYLDGNEVGTSYRDDYTNLGTEIGLHTMFNLADGPQNGGSPSTIWDDFEVGSDFAPVPEPATMTLLGLGLAGLAARRARKRS